MPAPVLDHPQAERKAESSDFKTATIEGPFSSAISDDPVVTVTAKVVCQD